MKTYSRRQYLEHLRNQLKFTQHYFPEYIRKIEQIKNQIKYVESNPFNIKTFVVH